MNTLQTSIFTPLYNFFEHALPPGSGNDDVYGLVGNYYDAYLSK